MNKLFSPASSEKINPKSNAKKILSSQSIVIIQDRPKKAERRRIRRKNNIKF